MTKCETILWSRLAGRAAAKLVFALFALVAVVIVAAVTWPTLRPSLAVSPALDGGGPPAGTEMGPTVAEAEPDRAEPTLGPFGPTDPAWRPAMDGFETGGPESMVDLSTPAAAVYSLLTLLEQGDTGQIDLCLVGNDPKITGGQYRRRMGHPVRLICIVEDERSASVQWEATALIAFERDGRQWSPGQYVPFTSRLIYDDGLWKVAAFME